MSNKFGMADNHISLEEVAKYESVITKEFRSEAEGYKFYNDLPFVDIFLKTRCIFRVTKKFSVLQKAWKCMKNS
uniref:Uncharacterized protein n=1 Tax=Oryza meridionalis TaxID=40149 RepID=A0A0E0CK53_9ORYZ